MVSEGFMKKVFNCIAEFRDDEMNVICYELIDGKAHRLMASDRSQRQRCKVCELLSVAIDKLVAAKQERDERWR